MHLTVFWFQVFMSPGDWEHSGNLLNWFDLSLPLNLAAASTTEKLLYLLSLVFFFNHSGGPYSEEMSTQAKVSFKYSYINLTFAKLLFLFDL